MRILEPAGRPDRETRPRSWDWPQPARARMARDFLLWRHLRVVRARAMRRLHRALALIRGRRDARPAMTAYGVAMWPAWDDRTYAYCHYGTYGPYLADLLSAIGEPFCFLDVGANQGLFSLIAARNPMAKRIVALEPVPTTHARLAANLELAGLGERATAVRAALSNRSGEATIAVRARHSGAATLGDHLASEGHGALTVKLTTMAEIAGLLPPHLPVFIKIDVEGHEPVVIAQVLGALPPGRVLGIFYEHDDRWTDDAMIAEAFARAGFAKLAVYGRGRHYDVLAGSVTEPLADAATPAEQPDPLARRAR